ncbi:hypothetical protein AALP_AA4G094400 [Arabis alpina]|uniref:Uncharacterized protein n=1 Tax=Arabis alpina TaxID=50452 RepID=A0A087H274_ARAAL|nr:hypothetical protein AALP_AA4G094400 [Arabis alpina]
MVDPSVTQPEIQGGFEECKRTSSVIFESFQLVQVISIGLIVSKHHGLTHVAPPPFIECICFKFILALFAFVTENKV